MAELLTLLAALTAGVEASGAARATIPLRGQVADRADMIINLLARHAAEQAQTP